jgi:hypothetical protein
MNVPLAPEIRKAGAVILIALVMASSFVAAYTVALSQPLPRHLPIGTVGPPAAASAAIRTLQGDEHSFDIHDFPTREAAVAAVQQQRIIAVVDATTTPSTLLLSSASDPSAARALTALDQQPPGRSLMPIVDLHPLPDSDPAGLVTFYLMIAATILGFVTMFQLRANVKTLTLKRWLICVFIVATAGGAALSAVAGPLLHALSAPYLQLWLLTSIQIAIAALFNSVMLVLVGRWAIIPTWVTFILLGNTSSGGAVSASLMPQPFAFLNHALPSGATVSAIQTATYFPHNQRALPFVVLAIWLVVCLVALLVSSRVLDRTPAE